MAENLQSIFYFIENEKKIKKLLKEALEKCFYSSVDEINNSIYRTHTNIPPLKFINQTKKITNKEFCFIHRKIKPHIETGFSISKKHSMFLIIKFDLKYFEYFQKKYNLKIYPVYEQFL